MARRVYCDRELSEGFAQVREGQLKTALRCPDPVCLIGGAAIKMIVDDNVEVALYGLRRRLCREGARYRDRRDGNAEQP
jgi:hypothetical protein